MVGLYMNEFTRVCVGDITCSRKAYMEAYHLRFDGNDRNTAVRTVEHGAVGIAFDFDRGIINVSMNQVHGTRTCAAEVWHKEMQARRFADVGKYGARG